MHTIPELGTGVPAFLAKLWKLVEDPETDDLICWSPNGRSFFIRNQAQFARELLPHYYKHNNMASFVRQLNMYGFHKKVSVELGGLKCDRDEMEFAHQFFCKGHPYLVEHIKRKIASSKGQDPAHTPMKPELMNKMLTEVRSMRGRQEHLDSRLGAMKRENEALWRELAMLRQKHLKQQQIVNKLIHFLVTLVQPSRGSGLTVKRRYPLMIDDSSRQRSKQAKLSKSETASTGPVIHELDSSESDLDSQYIVAEMLENHPNPAIESPEHQSSSIIDDENVETIQLVDQSDDLSNEIELITSDEIETKKKRGPKGKKKRKNKVPVKIFIPAMENGEEAREVTHILEMPIEDSPTSVPILESNTLNTKPVPLATVRSSKLAAMAANMNKQNEVDADLDLDTLDGEDDIRENDPNMMKLEDILIIPEIINEDLGESSAKKNARSEFIEDGYNSSSETIVDDGVAHVQAVESMLDGENQDDGPNTDSQTTESNDKEIEAGSSSSKDLSLRRVKSNNICEGTYREEMDNHLESMQNDLENLREILRNEGYSIDANTLLGLFGADDPMSFGIPVNPELDPHANKEKEEESECVSELMDGNNRGEIMAYSSTPTLLDFDDDMFLNDETPSPSTNLTTNNSNNDLCTPDPLELGDGKQSLLDSLVNNDIGTT
ncbi:heat shock factor protein-like isoform X2 [Prorops nasuta]|uniref:heat shock factor protein-like isoform X2 n=1 Tax=Prorops nasuta TaxID=863751 RepID=UPI0034CEB01D